MVHGEIWTIKELFVYPNEYIYWSIQIVMYPFMTGLVAGAFVLSSLYHVFGIKELRHIARFALVFSFALFIVAPMPIMLHLQHPLRGMRLLLTPHFTSAIAAFGVIYFTYGTIVALELWFLYREHFTRTVLALKEKQKKTPGERLYAAIVSSALLGKYDLSEEAHHRDERAIKVLAFTGIPVACLLHGYAGFIFGSVKANALWMTPLMPVIFIMSAIVSGIALCMLTYIVVLEIRKFTVTFRRKQTREILEEVKGAEMSIIRMTSTYLVLFMIGAISLELLDLIFRGYTAVKHWDILRTVIYDKDFMSIFILQYGLGNLAPFILFLLPGLTLRRTIVGLLLVIMGVFMMRWNVVIGGQAFSLTFLGYMEYHLPIIPHTWETFKEGLGGALAIAVLPFMLFWIMNKIFPVFEEAEQR